MQDALEEATALETRKRIYDEIDKSPGLHFRELQRRTLLAVGALQYHLDYLMKQHLIRADKDGKFVRYYTIRGKQVGEDKELLSLLRQPSIRKIILFIMQSKDANNTSISEAIQLSPSTTSSYLTKLTEKGVIEKRQAGRKSYFTVKEPERIAAILKEHKTSFLDDLVDNFVTVWDELAENNPAEKPAEPPEAQ
jgi:predicted transcriptional regulator